MIPILILAGGASSRMGARDKLTEDVDGLPLLRHQARNALTVSQNVTVLLRPGNEAARGSIDDLPVTILEPKAALEGMGGSLRAGTLALRDHPAFLLLLADLVEVTPNDMQQVIAARSQHPDARIWRGTTEDGAQGHPIVFDRAVFPDLLHLTGDDGGRAVITKHRAHLHRVPLPGQHARRDLDSPEDWARWRAEQRR